MRLLLPLLCGLAVATACHAATVTPTSDGFAIEAAAYTATVGNDGCLTSLKVAGQEFVFTNGAFPRGGYMYQDEMHLAKATTLVEPNACDCESDLGHWRYTFEDERITLTVENKSPRQLVYVIVYDPKLQAVKELRGRFRKVPANAGWADCTWYQGPAKLRLIAPASHWGPWGDGKHQVTTIGIPPGKSLTITMEPGMTDAQEQQQAKAEAERVIPPPTDPVGPMWDLKRFEQAPQIYPAEGVATNGTGGEAVAAEGVRGLFYDGPPYMGRPTRVFAWIGFPPNIKPGEKVPGMVLVHGGGGTAFANWVKLWNDRGYAAISMDTCGCVPVGEYSGWQTHEFGGPPGWGGFNQINEPREDQWTFHAVAAALLAHSLLRAQPQVDADRIGLTGISWGGYLTCIVAGVDPRYRFAAPVYGCGFTSENGIGASLPGLGAEGEARWLRWWDPSVYLPDVQYPMLWVNGTNDFAFTLNAYQKSYRVPRTPRTLAIRLRMPHGHGAAGEAPEEIRVFADSFLKGGVPMAKITSQGRDGMNVWATFAAQEPVTKAELLYTKDRGSWPERNWEAVPAELAGERGTATLPEGVTAYYLNLYDDRDCAVSTEHEELPE